MSRNISVILLIILVVYNPAIAQPASLGSLGHPVSIGQPQYGNNSGYGYNSGYTSNPGYNPGYNAAGRFTGNPNGYNPYNTMYGGYTYPNPYAPTYEGQYNINGISRPVYGPPQLINGNYYGINAGGIPAQFWRAPSGFYYPWVGGYNYRNYPIYVVPPNSNAPSQTIPPVSTIISDMDCYLDKAKDKGKISQADYQSLRLRANDLLRKEKSLAYEEGGSVDPDSEADIRRDVDGLSAEVAHRVKP